MVARAAQKDKDWPGKWNSSEQSKAVSKKIQELRDERKDVKVPDEIDTTSTYAASWATQFRLVTQRTFVSTWRDNNYLTGKIMIHILLGESL
jgi:ATP-binding cassette subfamily G (WHITE) protein 2 (PDR)